MSKPGEGMYDEGDCKCRGRMLFDGIIRVKEKHFKVYRCAKCEETKLIGLSEETAKGFHD